MGLTYGQVKQYILALAGEACGDTPQLEMLMASTAADMWNRLDDSETQVIDTFTTVTDQSVYPLTVTTFEQILSVEDANGCAQQMHQPYCDFSSSGCSCGSVYFDPWSSSWKATKNEALKWQITMSPPSVQPDLVYTVRGFGFFDPIMFDMSGATRIWRMVPLPEGLHYAYQESVLARALAPTDITRAGLASTVSAQMFDAWKIRQVRSSGSLGQTTIVGRFSKMGSSHDYDNPVEIFQKVAAP